MSGADLPPPAAVVFGCSGTELLDDERDLFRDTDPAGFILFARNIDTPDQVRRLVDALRATTRDDDPLILIDQEGGRVQRLAPPYWPVYPAMKPFGDKALTDPEEARACVTLNYRLIAADLADLGINVNCAPVLDLPLPGSHRIIGDRAFSDDPGLVASLGQAVCDGLIAGGIMPVIKHIPGHGRALSDSHLELPRVDTDIETLEETDFAPFRSLKDAPAGMTAHIVYSAVDSDTPGSASRNVVQDIIRSAIGFDGLLFSDDVCMKALSGPLDSRVSGVLAAGCDIALHCDGNFEDMRAIAETCPAMRPDSAARLRSARRACNDSAEFEHDAAKRRISALLNE